MTKAKTQFVCSECGAVHNKWSGQCSHCNAWNTLVESAVDNVSKNRFSKSLHKNTAVEKMADIKPESTRRIFTSIEEFDRVLGGGLVAGEVILLGGDPGIGKSTLLLQTLSALMQRHKVFYISGEESPAQIALRAQRLQLSCDDILLQAEINLEKILHTLSEIKPEIVVVDSIQTIYSDTLTSAPGAVAQVRECAAQLARYAKQSGTTIFLVGHVTKEGAIAGPRVLEHIVDAVFYFEGDTQSAFRLVRAVKNRYGAVNEIGVFAMTERGLRGVSNPSALFLSQHNSAVAGSCILVTQEGSRPLLVEIQALVDSSHLPHARRLSVGLEQNRLAMLLAVLHRHGGIATYDQDIFINAVGGVKISEPAADVAVLLSIYSSLRNKPLPKGLITFGEVGLAGEIRPAPRGQERLREAAKLGFSLAYIPKANAPRQAIEGMEVIALDRVEQLFQHIKDHVE